MTIIRERCIWTCRRKLLIYYWKIRKMCSEMRMINEELLHFQHDDAPPHCTRSVRDWLNNRFPQRRIGRRGLIEWPARSTNLNLNFFRLFKAVGLKTAPQNNDDLKNFTTAACRATSSETFLNVRQEIEQCLYWCLEVNGKHFE